MKQNYTHLVVLSDRSGSMSSIKKDVEGGFNTFIEEQKKADGECTISLAQFDTEYELLYSFKPISETPTFQVIPRGGTALYDSLAKLILDTGNAIKVMKEEDRPSKVIFIVSTDGEENSSREYSSDAVKKMVEEQTNTWKWDFVYLGANQDAVLTGGGLGFSKAASMSYSASATGVSNLYASLSSNVLMSRSTGNSVNFSSKDRIEAMEQ